MTDFEPTNAVGFVLRGRERMDAYDFEGAIADFTAALKLYPEDTDSFRLRGIAQASLKRYAEAIADFAAVIDLNRADARGYYRRGMAQSAQGNLAKAMEDLDTAIELKPEHDEYRLSRGAVAYECGRFEQSFSDFEFLIRRNPEKYRTDADVVFRRGCALNALGEHEKALLDFDAALAIKTDFFLCRKFRARALRGCGQYQDAIDELNIILEHDANDDQTLAYRGCIWKMLGEWTRSVADYTEAIQRAPEVPEYYCSRSDALHLLGGSEAAIADLKQAIDLDPLKDSYRLRLGDIFQSLGECQRAVDTYEESIRRNPDRPDGYLAVAALSSLCTLRSWRNGPRAVEYALRGCELVKSKNWYAHCIVAAAYAEAEQFQAGVESLEIVTDAKLLALNRKAPPADSLCASGFHLRGLANMKLGRYDAAKRDLERAFYECQPAAVTTAASILNALSFLFSWCPDAKIWDGNKAVAHATRAGTMRRWSDWVAYANLAGAHASIGEFDAAVQLAQTALEMAPEALKPERLERLVRYRAGQVWQGQP